MECKVRDINIHYEEVGTGKPVLIVHGWTLNGRIAMGNFEPAFAGRSGWRRIYVDMPGHGATPLPDWLHEHDDVVSILLEFMDAVAPGERFVIAGISWGGYVARGVVYQRPRQVDGVLLFSPCIILDYSKRIVPEHQAIYRDPAFGAALQPDEEWLLDMVVVQSTTVLDRIHSNLTDLFTEQDPQAERLYSHPFSFNADVLPEPCPAPALFLMGRQDNVVGYKDAWSLLDSYPRGTFAVLDRGGHMLSYEQRPLALALLSEWLDRVKEYIAQNER